MSDPRLAALETLRRRLCVEPNRRGTDGLKDPEREFPVLAATLGPDGLWPDIDYTNDHLKDWAAAAHLRRVRALAESWVRPESAFPCRDVILGAVARALDGWYALNPQNPNWWWNQIGAPLLLGETLLFVKEVCSPVHIERAAPAFACHQPISRFTGQNLIWTATVTIYHGLLTDDPDRVSHGFLLIGRELNIFADGEGIQPDMSFHQHGKLLYSGGYGQGFASDIARLMAVAQGTVYALPQNMVDLLARYILDGSRWMVRGRTFDPVASGREISRQDHDAHRFHEGLSYLAAFDHPRRMEAAQSAAVDPSAGRSMVIGNRLFWSSDLMVQHRPSYYLSVRVPSPRVWNADMACCGGEGRLCHHMADGVTMIMGDGDEYRDLFPVWNWRQIPGVTALQMNDPLHADALRRKGEHAFAGGASDGSGGCMAVDFATEGLSARKAWFLFDGGMVALGAGIQSADPAMPIRTTINQCRRRGDVLMANDMAPLADGVHPLRSGTSFWHDNVAYRILHGDGTLQIGEQTGAWSDCGVGSPERLRLGVVNAGLNHAAGETNAGYAYAVYPGTGRCVAFDGDNEPTVVANRPSLQAVWDGRERHGQAVFYEPAAVTFPNGQRIAVDRPCILLYRPEGSGGDSITLAQPEHNNGMITLTFGGRREGCLAVTLPEQHQAGSSVTLSWR